MPKLWRETVAEHRREVTQAILDKTVALVEQHGLRDVTMSQIAEATGIGRATLYKYYRDVEAILLAWHERHVALHLHEIDALSRGVGTPSERLTAVLEAYAMIRHKQPKGELFATLHQGQHVAEAQLKLASAIRGLLSECVETGVARNDIALSELTHFCMHAASGAGSVPTKAAVRRLVSLIVAALAPSA